MRGSRKLVTMLACVAASGALVGSAWAGQIFKDSFRDEGSLVVRSFCGVDGLTVRESWVANVRLSAVSQGRDQLPYFREHIRETLVYTNLANGATVTHKITDNGRDLKVTDNGDGTLTILVRVSGNAVLYGSDGKAIGRNPGQVRFEVLTDHGGTPSDPSDDEAIEFLRVVKGSTGRTDDFCETVVPALT